jgi:hypothetical protein
MKKILYIIICLSISNPSFGQLDSLNKYIEQLIENYVEQNGNGEFDYTNSFEILEELREKPYDLNRVSEEELNNLFFLSSNEIQAILKHRKDFGDFLAIQELQTVDALSESLIEILRYFLVVEEEIKNKFNIKSIGIGGKSNLYLKYKDVIQPQKGYLADPKKNNEVPFLGNDQHYFMRYKYESNNNFRIGFTAEKDYGEPFFKGRNKNGFDFYSGYVSMENISRKVNRIIIGDYTISMGQGLILQNNFGAGKSALVMNIKANSKTLKPYSSVNESNYFRGIAIELSPSSYTKATIFFSQKNIDGTINQDSSEVESFESISSIIRSGLHRTNGEFDKKNSATQTNYGLKTTWTYNRLRLGANYVGYQFSNPFPTPTSLYRKFNFASDQLNNISLDYNYNILNLNLFGEIARSDNGAVARNHGLLLPLHKRIDVSAMYRDYAYTYQVLEANAFGEASQPINEKGIYIGLETRPSNTWKFSGYVDLWRHPWLRYRVDAPSSGKEYLVRAEYNIKRKFNAYVQYRLEQKGINQFSPENKLDIVGIHQSHRLRGHMSTKVNKELEISSRAEATWYKKGVTSSKGFLIYQDFKFKPIDFPISVIMRYCLFDTDNFDTRIYTYENDVLYEFSFPFFYGSGQRAYTHLRYRLARNIMIEGRYSITKYDRLKIIGSGNDEIKGDTRSDVKLQIKYSF